MIRLEDHLARLPLVAILRGLRPEEANSIAEVLFASGFGVLEVPLNSPAPLESIATIAARFPDRLVGAGTVTAVREVDDVFDAGGRLVVMPHLDTSLVRRARDRGMICVPGVATPTEAFAALRSGADALKLFPAEMLQPEVVRAWRSVLPRATRLLPVGGITPDRIDAYWRAGADGFGLGSALFKPGLGPQQVERNAEAFRVAMDVARSGTGVR